MFEPDSSSQVESEKTQLLHSQPFNSGQMDISMQKNGEAKEKFISTNLAENVDNQPTADNTLSSTTEAMNIPAKIEKVCRVCGDKAKSFHFGGLSCDSCKAFFRRSVHNSAFESFQCTGIAPGTPCSITLNSRKSCQFCRFKKCIANGMEKKWVMTEEERSNLNKQRKEKKEEKVAAIIPTEVKPAEEKYEPDLAKMLNFMTIEERDGIESVVQKYQHSYREMPFSASKHAETRNPVEIVGMFTTILRRFAYFAKLLPEFNNLSVDDQSTLLRGGVLEMCLLRSALAFDIKNNRWPRTDNADFLKDCPQLKVEDMERLVSKELFVMHMKFINGIQELNADEPVVMVLLLIVLFHPERGNIQDPGYVSEVQDKYVNLLNKYTQWRYGPKSSKAFPKLLTKLADLRELNDFHTEYNLKMSKKEVDTIQEQLGQINLNPYPQWVLVQDERAGRGGMHQGKAMRETMMGMGMGMGQNLNMPNLPIGNRSGNGGMPSTRELFMNFVNNKIPTLIENPFAPMDMAGDMAAGMAAMAQFQQMQQQQVQQQQQQEQQFPQATLEVGEIPPNFEYRFSQGHHPSESAQLMQEFLQNDRNLNPHLQVQQQQSFVASGQNQFYGHTHNFAAMGQQTFQEHIGWQDPALALQEELTFPDANAILQQAANQGHINQNWRHPENY